ncbi:Putative CAMK/CAMKL/KIN1 protein kinase [Rhizopus microsporus]|nr:Putative CAMK/CAMKL/KIN1 protein kinase [Rhizopus microsporus]
MSHASHSLPPVQFSDKTVRRSRSRHQVQQIGNYVIYKKTLGSGSMGTVKLAESLSPKDHQLYAVKIMPKINLDLPVNGNSKDPKDTPREREQRTVREMAIMHLLRHPNICQLKEWIVHGDHYYMFLEYIEGGQLLDYIIGHGKLREKLARKFARQIASALDYCHRNSIVHRDLKIENILLTNNEEIKIIDFGLSNIYSPRKLLNTFCGSLYFAAPELLQAKNYTGPEVDVWSFGVVLYVLVCGRVPFDDTSLPALHEKIKAGQVEYPDHLSRECVDLLSKILVVDPRKRETLSNVIRHPWMNKGYDELVSNHLPHRQPLHKIDRQVVQGMQGFGLGLPEEIGHKLEQIIRSPEYQYAAKQIDQNYQDNHNNTESSQQQQQQQQQHNSLTRWRRTVSIRRTASSLHSKPRDDPQSLPAMYDPLISIYYLVKERREFDEKIRLLESEGYQSPVQLGRSASTSLSKSTKETNSYLTRRKTERVAPSHTRQVFQQHNEEDWAAPTNHSTTVQKNSSKSSSNLLKRSKSAAKRLGAMLPTRGGSHESIEDGPLKQKTMNILRSNSVAHRNRENNNNNNTGRFVEETEVTIPPNISTYPKSLFNFNRRHLFKVTAKEMIEYVERVLRWKNIFYKQEEPFVFKCEIQDEAIEKEHVVFSLMIYQARWANGRLGIKLLENENTKTISIYHEILNELDSLINK